MKSFAGKNIWIIGASSGIGRALALHLAAKGAKLTLSARRPQELDSLNEELGGACLVLPLDAANADDVNKAAAHIAQICGRIDSMVYMAAVYEPGAIADIQTEKLKQMIDINLTGAFHAVLASLPVLKSQGGGQIVLCASVAGYRGLPRGQPYSATKAAMINFAESLRAEESCNGIDVKVINPGFVRTPMTGKNDFSMPFIIEPEEAASAIARGMSGTSFEIHFPRRLTFLMKLIRLLPERVYFLLATRI